MADTTGTRRKNLSMILKTIETSGEVTAAMLTERTGLSAATISRALTVLKSQSLIVQLRKQTTEIGRKPDVFSINPTFGYNLYYYLESDHLRGYLLNLGGYVLASRAVDVSQELTLEQLMQILSELKQTLLTGRRRAQSRLLASNIAIPGVIDAKTGAVSRIPNFPNLERTQLREAAAQALQLPCFLYNASRLSTIGAYLQYGAGVGSFVYIDITGDCGVGAGIVLDGELYDGPDGLAGEIGDMILELDRDSSGRQSSGALERQAGLASVYDRVRRLLQDGRAQTLRAMMEQRGSAALNLQLLEKAAGAMDLDVFDTLNQTVRAWAAAIVNILAVLSAELVIVGGAVTQENELVEKMLRHHLAGLYHRPVALQLTEAGSDAHVRGAVYLSKKYLFEAALDGVLES